MFLDTPPLQPELRPAPMHQESAREEAAAGG
jgi:hypothetical protein